MTLQKVQTQNVGGLNAVVQCARGTPTLVKFSLLKVLLHVCLLL
jgi:hypothetical protein